MSKFKAAETTEDLLAAPAKFRFGPRIIIGTDGEGDYWIASHIANQEEAVHILEFALGVARNGWQPEPA